MIKTGLWIELEAIVGFIVGLGLGSLLGQRTVAVILMIVLEIILTPILSRAHIPHLINLQRSVVGLAVAHLEPSGLGFVFGGAEARAEAKGHPGSYQRRRPWPFASSLLGWWVGPSSARGG